MLIIGTFKKELGKLGEGIYLEIIILEGTYKSL